MFETYFLFLILLIMITYDNNLLYELKNNKIWQMVFVCIVLYISYNSLILGIIVILIFAFFYERNSKYGTFEYFSLTSALRLLGSCLFVFVLYVQLQLGSYSNFVSMLSTV